MATKNDQPVTPAIDLPLINRYHAAWLEHGTRVAQRQNAVQIYLTVSGVLFGFYFAQPDHTVEKKQFIVIAVTLLTFYIAMTIWMHHRVMKNLFDFMVRCELACKKSITDSCPELPLFYFLDTGTGKVVAFHKQQRNIHRVVLATMLASTNVAAILLVRSPELDSIVWACLGVLAFAIFIPILDAQFPNWGGA